MTYKINVHASKELLEDPAALKAWMNTAAERECAKLGMKLIPDSESLFRDNGTTSLVFGCQ